MASRSHTKTQSVWPLWWSARRRDFYLTTLNTHNRQTPPVGFEPTISSGERPQIYALDRVATGTGKDTYSDTDLDSLVISWKVSECNMVKIFLFRKYLIYILFGWPGALTAGFPRCLRVDFRTQKNVTIFSSGSVNIDKSCSFPGFIYPAVEATLWKNPTTNYSLTEDHLVPMGLEQGKRIRSWYEIVTSWFFMAVNSHNVVCWGMALCCSPIDDYQSFVDACSVHFSRTVWTTCNLHICDVGPIQ
jgi:hypothetical protein